MLSTGGVQLQGGLGRVRGVGGGGGGWGGGGGRGRGQGTFHLPCHILHYHMVLRPKGTSHNDHRAECLPHLWSVISVCSVLFAGAIAMGEIKNLEHLPQHPNLVQYKGYHFHKDAFWVVIEFCDMGDLSDYYKKYFPAKIPLAHQIHFMYQVRTFGVCSRAPCVSSHHYHRNDQIFETLHNWLQRGIVLLNQHTSGMVLLGS